MHQLPGGNHLVSVSRPPAAATLGSTHPSSKRTWSLPLPVAPWLTGVGAPPAKESSERGKPKLVATQKRAGAAHKLTASPHMATRLQTYTLSQAIHTHAAHGELASSTRLESDLNLALGDEGAGDGGAQQVQRPRTES